MITKDQVKVVLLCSGVNKRTVNKAATRIMNLFHPRKYPIVKTVIISNKIHLKDVPVGKNFRMTIQGKEFIKMSESTYKCFCSTGKRNRWLSINHLVYPVKY